MTSVLVWIGVGIVGGLGAVARVLVGEAVRRRAGRRFPYGTLAVNLSGAFALGLLAGAGVGDDGDLLLGAGFLGAYTTYSTWMVESYALAQRALRLAALANVAGSLALGLVVALAGHELGLAMR